MGMNLISSINISVVFACIVIYVWALSKQVIETNKESKYNKYKTIALVSAILCAICIVLIVPLSTIGL